MTKQADSGVELKLEHEQEDEDEVNIQSMVITRFFFRLLRHAAHMPLMDRRKLQKIIREETDTRERQLLERDFSELKRGEQSYFFYALAAMVIIYVLKSVLYVVRTIKLVDYIDIESNLQVIYGDGIDNESMLIRFTCMTTNCTRLTRAANSLEEDMISLPVLDICDPLSSIFPAPFKYLDRVSVLLVLCLGFGAVSDSLFVQFFHRIRGRSNECCVFMQAPRLAMVLFREKLAPIVEHLRYSCDKSFTYDYGRIWQTFLASDNDEPLREATSILESGNEQEMDEVYAGKFALGFLPFVRTTWFCRKLNDITGFMALQGAFGSIGASYMTLTWLFDALLPQKARLYQEFDDEMRAQNCAVWLTEDPNTRIDPKRVDLSRYWTVLGASESVIGRLFPGAIALMVFLIFYLTSLEITCWQSELHNQLRFLVEFKRLSGDLARNRILDDRPTRFISNSLPRRQIVRSVIADIAMKTLQQEFKQANQVSFYVMRTNLIRTRNASALTQHFSHSQLDTALAFQDLSLQTLHLIDCGGRIVSPDEVHFSMMERVYVNFCLYVEQITYYTPGITVSIMHGYLLLYGLMIISAWYCYRVAPGQLGVIIWVVVGVWWHCNNVLLVSSSIHAKVSLRPHS